MKLELICNPAKELMDLDIEHGQQQTLQKGGHPKLMCFLMKEHTTTCSLAKGSDTSLIKPLDPAAIFRNPGKRNKPYCIASVQSAKSRL